MLPRALTLVVALSLGLGALVVGHGLIVPASAQASALADANLARALTEPAALRVAECAALACAILWLAALKTWPRGAATTLSFAATVACVVDRVWLIPRTFSLGARVDLVTSAPAGAMAEYSRGQLIHQLAVATASVLLAAVAVLLARQIADALAKSQRDAAMAREREALAARDAQRREAAERVGASTGHDDDRSLAA